MSSAGSQTLLPGSIYLGFSEDREQLTAWHVIHDHVEVGVVLEGAPEVDDERVRDTHQDRPLALGMADLL